MAAQRVDQLGSLTHQGLAHLQNHTLSLLRDGLHQHEMHAWPSSRFTDRLGVISVVLAAFDIGFDVLGRNQTHLVTERGQFASPIVRAAAGFHGDLGGWEPLKESQQLWTTESGS